MKSLMLSIALAMSVMFADACRTPDAQGFSGRDPGTVATGGELREAIGGNGKEMDPNQMAREVLVKFKPGVTRAAVDRIAQVQGLKIVRLVSPPDLYLFEIREAVSVQEMIQRISRLAEVEYAEPNYTRK